MTRDDSFTRRWPWALRLSVLAAAMAVIAFVVYDAQRSANPEPKPGDARATEPAGAAVDARGPAAEEPRAKAPPAEAPVFLPSTKAFAPTFELPRGDRASATSGKPPVFLPSTKAPAVRLGDGFILGHGAGGMGFSDGEGAGQGFGRIHGMGTIDTSPSADQAPKNAPRTERGPKKTDKRVFLPSTKKIEIDFGTVPQQRSE